MANETGELVARRLRTGEIPVWDAESKTAFLLSPGTEGAPAVVKELRGSTLKALEDSLGELVMLV